MGILWRCKRVNWCKILRALADTCDEIRTCFSWYHCYVSAWPDSHGLCSPHFRELGLAWAACLEAECVSVALHSHLDLTQFHPEPISLSHHLIHFPSLQSFTALFPGLQPQDGYPQWVYNSTAHRSRLTLPAHPYHLPPFTGCPVFQPWNNLPTLNTLSGCSPSNSFHSERSLIMKKSPYIIQMQLKT